jgi:hypothetical protein
MSLEVKIVGFDKSSERLVFEKPVPVGAVAYVKTIADVPATDHDLLGSYPLTAAQVSKVAAAAQITIDPTEFSYFLEADEA